MEDIQTIGIVGGGQLGRMLTVAAKQLGFDVVVVEKSKACPAAQVGARVIEGNLYDADALNQLAKVADVITVEIEHFDTTALQAVADAGTTVHPYATTVKLIQDKYLQKQHFADVGVAVGDFSNVKDLKEAKDLLKEYGGSMMLKSRNGAYDGRGNALVTSTAELEEAWEGFDGAPLYAERLIDFKAELAVMVAQSADSIVTYPTTQTIHERSICLQTLTPAPFDQKIITAAQEFAKNVVSHLEGSGMYGVEMFLTGDDKILLNEVAPRVHNSGHYTPDGCITGQFEQHIRAITGLPLGSTDLVRPAVSMMNILGERNGETKLTGLSEALALADKDTDVFIHDYGKSPTKIDRKMGHLNVIGQDLDHVVAVAQKARERIDI